MLVGINFYTMLANGDQPVVQQTQQEQKTGTTMPNFLNMKALDPKSIKEIFESLQKMKNNEDKQHVAKLKQEVLLLLPQTLSHNITATQKHYFDFLESLTIPHRFKSLALDIDQALPLITDQTIKAHKDVFAESLKKFRTSVESGSFLNIFFPGYTLSGTLNDRSIDAFSSIMGLFDDTPQPEDPYRYTIENAQKFKEDLVAFLKAFDESPAPLENKKVVQKKLQDLLTMLEYVQKNNAAELAQFCVSLAEDQFVGMTREIGDIVHALSEFYVDSTGQHSQTLSAVDKMHQEGIQVWLNEFKSYNDTIDAFISLYKKSQLDLSLVLLTLQRAIEITEPIIYFYQVDLKDSKAWIASFALHLSLGGTMFFDQQGQNARDLLVNKLLMQHKEGLHGFVNPLEQFEFGGAQLAVLSAQSFMPGMSAAKGHTPLPFFEKVLLQLILVWAVYQGSYEYLNTQNGNEGFTLWPNAYAPLRAVLYNAFKGIQMTAAYKIRDGIKNISDPIALENLEFFSLGLISPDIVFDLSDILFQFIFYKFEDKTSGIVAFDNNDLFKYDYLFRLNMHRKYGKEYPEERWDLFKEYVTYSLILHITENIGKFCGTQIGYMASESIEDAALKATTTITNWLSGTNQKPETLKREITQGIYILKVMIQMIMTDENTAPRLLLINFLKTQNYIDRDLSDPSKLNLELMRVCLFYLTTMNLLSHSQYVVFSEQYVQNPLALKTVIDNVFVAVKDKMTAAACGQLGKYLGKVVGSFAFRHMGKV